MAFFNPRWVYVTLRKLRVIKSNKIWYFGWIYMGRGLVTSFGCCKYVFYKFYTEGGWSWEGSYFFTLSGSFSTLAHFRFPSSHFAQDILISFLYFFPSFDLISFCSGSIFQFSFGLLFIWIFFADPILVQDSAKADANVLWEWGKRPVKGLAWIWPNSEQEVG